MRGFKCRGLRLLGFAGLGMAMTMPVLAASSAATQTRLSAETRDQNGRTRATLSINVSSEDGLPAKGAVVIEDAGKPLSGAALKADGTVQLSVDLPPGSHSLQAVYSGDSAHRASVSDLSGVNAASGSTPGFTVAVSPGSLSLTAGKSGTVAVSITPVNSSALTAPMFVTLSCSGTPDQSSCAFTPENVEILPNASAVVPSSMVIATAAGGTRGSLSPMGRPSGNPVAWAVLLPGAFGLMGAAFAARRRRWLQRLSLIALLGLVSVLGATACAARYNYYNHGPPYNLPTPAGTYTLTVAAQSSNGVTAITDTSAKIALTVK